MESEDTTKKSIEENSKYKKLKILYILPRFHPFKGGAEINLLAMAERMAALGNEVDVYTGNYKFRDEKLNTFEEFKGIKIYRFKSFIQRPFYLAFIPELLPKILKSNHDVIHVSGFGFIWIEFCLMLKRILYPKSKIINTPHGPFMAQRDNKGFRGFSRKVYQNILKHILPRIYNKVIAVLPKQKTWLKDLYNFKEENIFVVPNGIDKEYIEQVVPTYKKEDKVVITYLNRMEWYKGIQDVIMAIAQLNKEKNINKLPVFEFWIMGRPAKFTETLKRMVTENNLNDQIKFIYSPSDEDRDAAFLQSQINILPSKWEAFGIVLLEAMAKGNVIITTKQNQAEDILIKPEVTGYSYEFGDVENLTKILRKILEDYDLRQKIIKNNIEYAKNFTWDTVFPEYKKNVLELVNNV